jgi:hypothetical protein
MEILVMILSCGFGSMGILSLIKISDSIKLDYFRKLKGVNIFFLWLILSNILFYIYFLLQSILYNEIIVKSDNYEPINGSAGGYLTTEDIAENYWSISSFLIWIFITINGILFISRFFLKPNPVEILRNENIKGIFTILLLVLSLIMSIVSLLFFIFLDEFSVSYGG